MPSNYRVDNPFDNASNKVEEWPDVADVGIRRPWNEWLVGSSSKMQSIVDQVARFANSKAPVLITGDSGTGKEVIARLVHYLSDRSTENYVRVNCAALSESLIESELFGHEKGAFTGASERRVGRLEWAGEGTVLLDEISEIAPPLQAKLLRVLEEEEFQRVGSNQSFALRARIIATSNRCLSSEVTAGRFREDLYYRLNVLQVQLPKLCERSEDVPELVEHFTRVFENEGPGHGLQWSPEAMQTLQAYRWPGNVRQLRNTVRRLCILSTDATIRMDDIRDFGQLEEMVESECNTPNIMTPDVFAMTLDEAKQFLVSQALRHYQGNQTAAARHLGVSPRTLHNYLKRSPEIAPFRRAA